MSGGPLLRGQVRLLPGAPAFDPFPYSLGGEILSLESVLLAAFVLMKQAHEGRMSERRSHLNLQVNLRAIAYEFPSRRFSLAMMDFGGSGQIWLD